MKNKLTTPVALIIVAIVLGISFIVVQNNKTNSIEQQKKEETKTELLKIKQEECASMLPGLKANWYNIIGLKYNEFYEECEVTYYDIENQDQISTALLSSLQTVK